MIISGSIFVSIRYHKKIGCPKNIGQPKFYYYIPISERGSGKSTIMNWETRTTAMRAIG